MSSKLKTLFLLSIISLFTTSCVFKKDVVYFQDVQPNGSTPINYTLPNIQVNDILNIKVTALVPESVAVFNSMNNSLETSTTNMAFSTDILKLYGYLVSADGTITFPVIGRMMAKGKTTRQIEDYIIGRLVDEGYVKNPVVAVRILNAKFSVLGEVRNPGTYSYIEQSITLPQALGIAGDMNISGERKNVLIIRDEDGNRTYKKIDMTKTDWFNSPYYFIKQNDVIIVNPNGAKVATAGYLGNVANLLSVVATFLTLYVLIR
ncbi:MAG: ligand-binding protein [Flavobacterium sp. BFFFF2]|nr:MAG: ligand-binding protein [Flavobacterium sp. BFFFF2]